MYTVDWSNYIWNLSIQTVYLDVNYLLIGGNPRQSNLKFFIQVNIYLRENVSIWNFMKSTYEKKKIER